MTAQFPEWIRRQWPSGDQVQFTKGLLEELNLHTVCQSAHCPNQGECWRSRTATMMILGNTCTRGCLYCSVNKGNPAELDDNEPENVAEAVRRLGLRHAVITSVTRDDLPDGGAEHFARTITAIRALNPDTTVEVLVPDFQGNMDSVGRVLEARPDVFGHNLETVARLFPSLRSGRASYDISLAVLEAASKWPSAPVIKSGLMVGHGETEEEVVQTLRDLLSHGCEAVTIGQYLRPTKMQVKVRSFVPPEQFEAYERTAHGMGFRFALAGPFVRSSYRSEEMMKQGIEQDRFRHKNSVPA